MARAVRHVSTRFGEIAVEDAGSGPPALFVHGIFLNGHLWRHVVPRVAHARRCVCVDLLAHGETQAADSVEMRFTVQAEMLATVIDALGFDTIDLVANDSGGGIAQLFAAAHPARLRSLTLTNCDTHDNWPPPALAPLMEVARAGGIAELGARMLADLDFARSSLAIGYEHPERLSDETLLTYLAPLFATPARTAAFADWFAHMDCAQTVAIEPALRALAVPTLIMWGDADPFFPVEWAHWLARTIPGARPPVILPGAKLFFPEERPAALADALLTLWGAPVARVA